MAKNIKQNQPIVWVLNLGSKLNQQAAANGGIGNDINREAD
ncbi:hypothetical protein ACFSQQ_11915 [Mesorhizobium kowhaii]